MKYLSIFLLYILFIPFHSASATTDALLDEFVLGLAARPNSLDPHYEYSGPTYTFAGHCFEHLTFAAETDGKVRYRLAESHEWQDDHHLVIKLRKDVKFHDGTHLTSKDVRYSIERIQQMDDSQFKHAVANFNDIQTPDDHTVILKANSPRDMKVLNGLAGIYIVRHQDHILSRAEMERPENMIGTGPYRFMKREANGDILLEAFPEHHSTPPYLRKVRLHFESNAQKRLEKLVSGKLDLIEKITPDAIKSLQQPEKFNFFKITSYRIIHLQMDTSRTESPFIFTADGKPMKKNPLQDVRVRQAISLAINREALAEDVLWGSGQPAGQLVPEGSIGHQAKLTPDEYHPEQAKALLTEAGYPDGFRLVLHGPNDRYLNDKEIMLSIAKMLSKVGIQTSVKDMPKSIYFPSMVKHEYSFMLLGFSTTGRLDVMLKMLLATPLHKKQGSYNLGRYSNPKVDELLNEADVDKHEIRKLRTLRLANQLLLEDYALIPLYFEKTVWASRKGVTYQPYKTESTRATRVFAQ